MLRYTIRMQLKNISLGLVLLCVMSVLSPTNVEAYFTTNQSATAFTSSTALFAIEYAFGLPDNDIYMPVTTKRGLPLKSPEHSVGYSLYTGEDEVTTKGTVASIVISDAPIVDGMYYIEKGKSRTMTLLVIYTANETFAETYKLQVDQLPYYVDIDAEALDVRQLNPSELQYYVTKSVELQN